MSKIEIPYSGDFSDSDGSGFSSAATHGQCGYEAPSPLDIIPPVMQPIPGRSPGDRIVRIQRPKIPGVRRVSRGVYEITRESVPGSWAGRFWAWANRSLLGAPIRSEHEVQERLTRFRALGIFASDNISSSAYATEEIMRVLFLAGGAALLLTGPITLALIALLSIVTISYRQTIRAYPSGGGSYIVAKDNLGVIPGLVAGTALLIDYVLTVAVSISAGMAALTSAFPGLYPERVLLCLAAITILTLGNLRGIRESGAWFSAPVYLYMVGMLGTFAYGLLRVLMGGLPPLPPPAQIAATEGQFLGAFLLLRAFSSGAVALTGVEAVSNGIQAFRPPESRNASITLTWMAVFFGSIFLGMSFFAGRFAIIPDPGEVETVASQVTRAILGTGGFYYLVQFSTAVILFLAANTSFAGFPRLVSIMAQDGFFPTRFTFRGDRLAFNNGIIMLAMVAGALVVAFSGSVTSLIPLYTIGVFVAFTLSQGGMVVRWWRRRESGWRWSMLVNIVGCAATALVALVVGITKFALGAWMVLLLCPMFVLLLLGIRRHYQEVADQVVVDLNNREEHPERIGRRLSHYIVIPVAELNLPTIQAIAYARSLAGFSTSGPGAAEKAGTVIQAVHVTDDLTAGQRLLERWERLECGVSLSLINSPYRALVGPLFHYLDAVEKQHKGESPMITVLLPELAPANWWENLLHTQTGLRLKRHLFSRPKTAVISVPYHL